ncbi:transposase [Janthinobacterium fluminis]|uniref:Transposase n=1 Tax=Janthinobacterium fluminis TaxID=2987524 RepID=A0ABT5K6Y0_9BURK|nr:transposase [Janthinobacterium fluminis]MDC8760749.1 transposase [Janthinobacterium fluminis]
MSTPKDDYDTPWKDAVTRYFPAFMAFYFPLAYEQIDWSRGHVFLDKELAQVARDAALGKRLADKLVQLSLRGGGEQWLLLHLEVQGRRERRFAERMFTYNYRIFDLYRRPVASLALLSDDSAHWKPHAFGYSCFGCRMGIDFPIVKLRDFAGRPEALLADANPFALLTAAYLAARDTKGKAERRAEEKWRLLTLLLERNWDRQAIMDLLMVIDWMMWLPKPLERALWQRIGEQERSRKMPYISSIERIGLERGRKEGRLEGQVEGQVLMLSQLLAERFGALPAPVRQRLAHATAAELKAWSKAFVRAKALDEVFQA